MKLICILIGYLCGNFLTAEVVAKVKGLNVREIDPHAKHHGNPLLDCICDMRPYCINHGLFKLSRSTCSNYRNTICVLCGKS